MNDAFLRVYPATSVVNGFIQMGPIRRSEAIFQLRDRWTGSRDRHSADAVKAFRLRIPPASETFQTQSTSSSKISTEKQELFT